MGIPSEGERLPFRPRTPEGGFAFQRKSNPTKGVLISWLHTLSPLLFSRCVSAVLILCWFITGFWIFHCDSVRRVFLIFTVAEMSEWKSSSLNGNIHLLNPDLSPTSECSAACETRHSESAHVEHKGQTTDATIMSNAPQRFSHKQNNPQTKISRFVL